MIGHYAVRDEMERATFATVGNKLQVIDRENRHKREILPRLVADWKARKGQRRFTDIGHNVLYCFSCQ